MCKESLYLFICSPPYSDISNLSANTIFLGYIKTIPTSFKSVLLLLIKDTSNSIVPISCLINFFEGEV